MTMAKEVKVPVRVACIVARRNISSSGVVIATTLHHFQDMLYLYIAAMHVQLTLLA